MIYLLLCFLSFVWDFFFFFLPQYCSVVCQRRCCIVIAWGRTSASCIDKKCSVMWCDVMCDVGAMRCRPSKFCEWSSNLLCILSPAWIIFEMIDGLVGFSSPVCYAATYECRTWFNEKETFSSKVILIHSFVCMNRTMVIPNTVFLITIINCSSILVLPKNSVIPVYVQIPK